MKKLLLIIGLLGAFAQNCFAGEAGDGAGLDADRARWAAEEAIREAAQAEAQDEIDKKTYKLHLTNNNTFVEVSEDFIKACATLNDMINVMAEDDVANVAIPIACDAIPKDFVFLGALLNAQTPEKAQKLCDHVYLSGGITLNKLVNLYKLLNFLAPSAEKHDFFIYYLSKQLNKIDTTQALSPDIQAALKAINEHPTLKLLIIESLYEHSPYCRIMHTGLSGSIETVCFSPDGTSLLTGADSGATTIVNAADGETIRLCEENIDRINSLCFSASGNFIASTSDSQTHILDSNTGRIDYTINHDERYPGTKSLLSPDEDGNKLLLYHSEDPAVLWDVENDVEIATLNVNDHVITAAFSPDGTIIATDSSIDANSIKIWDVQTGALLNTLEGHEHSVIEIAFSPNGELLASTSSDNSIKIWNVAARSLVRTLEGHEDSVYSVAFSPDEKSLATGSLDQSIKIWNVQTGALLKTIIGHSDAIYKVIFNPDGKLIMSLSSDQTAKIWNVKTGFFCDSFEIDDDTNEQTACFSTHNSTLAACNASYDMKIGQNCFTRAGITTIEDARKKTIEKIIAVVRCNAQETEATDSDEE